MLLDRGMVSRGVMSEPANRSGPANSEPVYTFKPGTGWVIQTKAIEILGQNDLFVVVDLADVPDNMERSYAPWHPKYKVNGNNGKGVSDALLEAHNGNWFTFGTQEKRGQMVCAIRMVDYNKLVSRE